MGESTPAVMHERPAEESQSAVRTPPAEESQAPWNTDQLQSALARLLGAILETLPELGEAIFLGAVPLWFDQDLLAALRRKTDGLEDIILERMSRLPFVEIAQGRFRYRRDVRRQLLVQWQEYPVRLAEVNERALEYLEAQLAITPHDSSWHKVLVQAELHHRLAVDEPAGLKQLQALFREAEDRHRLADAEQYLDIVLNQRSLLSPEGCVYLDYMQGRLDQLYEDWVGSRKRFETLLGGETLSAELAPFVHRARARSLAEEGRWAEGIPEYEVALASFKRRADPAETARTMAGLGHAYLSWALSVWGSGWLQQAPRLSRFRFLYDLGNLFVRLPLVIYLMVKMGFGSMLPVAHRIGYDVDWIVARLLGMAAEWLHQAERLLGQGQVEGESPLEGDAAALIRVREDLAHLNRLLNNPRQAEAINEKLLSMEAVKLDDYRAARARLGIAHALLLRYEAAQAKPLLEETLPIFQGYGHRRRVAETQTLLARAESLMGELPDAIVHYNKALASWQLVGDQTGVTDVVQEMEALQNQSGLSALSQETVDPASQRVRRRHYLTRYQHPVLLNFQKVSLVAFVIVFFLAIWLAIHNESGAAIGATAALFKPVYEKLPTTEELKPDLVLTVREQLRPRTEPKVFAVAFGGTLVGYLVLYTLVGLYFITTTPLHTVRRGRLRGVVIDDDGIANLIAEGESGRLDWGSVRSLIVANRVLGRWPLTIVSSVTLLGQQGHLKVTAFTRHYESLQPQIRERFAQEMVRNLGFSIPRSVSGWIFVASLAFLLLFSILSWLTPDALTQSWGPIPYSPADLYWLAYLGVGFPLGWWFVVQPLRARFLVNPRSRLIWWVGAAGMILAILYVLQVLVVQMPVPRPDVALGVISIVLTGLFAKQITGARQPGVDGTEELVHSSRVRVFALLGALMAIAIVLCSIFWELFGFHHLVRGNYYWREAEKPGEREPEDFSDALNAYGDALVFRKEAAVYNSRGAIFARLGDYEEAIRQYEIALELKPREWAYASNMALAYAGWAAQTDNPAQRFERYGRAVGLHNVTITEMEEKLTLYTLQDVTAHLLRADALYDLGQMYETDELFRDEAIALAMFQAAMEDYQWVVDHHPRDPVGYTGRGWARLRLQELAGEDVIKRRGSLKQALADFDRAVELTAATVPEVDRDARYIPAFRGLGWAYYYLAMSYPECAKGDDPPGAEQYQENLDSAIHYYARLIGRQREAAIHYRSRAQFEWLLSRCDAQDQQKRLQQSLADYDEALKLAPGQAQWYDRRGHLHYALADLYKDQESKEQSRRSALEDLEEAAKLRETSVASWIELAKVAYAYGDYKIAARGYEQAARLEPENGDHFWKLGWRLYLIGDYQRSVEASGRAIALLPLL
jgi:tetratricopeptide (TPR) repeat protein